MADNVKGESMTKQGVGSVDKITPLNKEYAPSIGFLAVIDIENIAAESTRTLSEMWAEIISDGSAAQEDGVTGIDHDQ